LQSSVAADVIDLAEFDLGGILSPVDHSPFDLSLIIERI
jgi:hypothetical protein